MLSPDKYVQDGTNTQAYNRYSYVMNNPLKYTDPSGWKLKSDWGQMAIDSDEGKAGGGGSRYIGGLDLTGGVSNYNYMGSFSAYSSNSALYSILYGTQTWMQATTSAIYEAQKKAKEGSTQTNDSYKTNDAQKIARIAALINRGNNGYDIYDVMTGTPGVTIYANAFGGFTTDMLSLNNTYQWIQNQINSGELNSIPGTLNNFIGAGSTGIDGAIKVFSYKGTREFIRQGLYDVSKVLKGTNLSFKPGVVFQGIKSSLREAGTMSPKLGVASIALTALDYQMNGDTWTTGQWVNAGLSTALTIGAMFNPVVATGAFVYGAFQLGSWMYNGKSVEVNIESLIIKP